MEKQKLIDEFGWPAYGTFAWLAVMYAILSIGMTFSNKTLAQVKRSKLETFYKNFVFRLQTMPAFAAYSQVSL